MKFYMNKFSLIDHTNKNQKDCLASFATDDLLCEWVGANKIEPIIRLWSHESSVVLGILDMKLPQLQEGISYLKFQGYESRMRNSGGLAVVLDEGVLNLSMILPEKESKITIDNGYENMWNLIKLLLEDFEVEIEAKEIVGSYCPGSFDLSINGKKFAGISQRRIKGAIAVQIYLCLNGSGSKRAELIKSFYKESKAAQAERNIYPNIVPEVMASLNELLQVELNVQEWKERVINALKNAHLVASISTLDVSKEEKYSFYYERLIERNKELIDNE